VTQQFSLILSGGPAHQWFMKERQVPSLSCFPHKSSSAFTPRETRAPMGRDDEDGLEALRSLVGNTLPVFGNFFPFSFRGVRIRQQLTALYV
jgi:hypothetical protein